MKPKLNIVKIGGNITGDPQALERVLTAFASLPGPKILVHGGGRKATDVANKLGLSPKMVDGRRITDAKNLEVALMVYAGLTNKNIVARLQAENCNALGLSGADADTIRAVKRPVAEIDYGFVGDIISINTKAITGFLQGGITPVFCALSHDGKGQLLNTNADTIAAEIAIGLSKVYGTTLYYCFEKPGVLKDIADGTSVIAHINKTSYKALLEAGVIADGMLPKLTNCFHALDHGVRKVCIGRAQMLTDKNETFTTISLKP